VAGAAAEHQPPGDGDPATADWLRQGVPTWMLGRFRMNGEYDEGAKREKERTTVKEKGRNGTNRKRISKIKYRWDPKLRETKV